MNHLEFKAAPRGDAQWGDFFFQFLKFQFQRNLLRDQRAYSTQNDIQYQQTNFLLMPYSRFYNILPFLIFSNLQPVRFNSFILHFNITDSVPSPPASECPVLRRSYRTAPWHWHTLSVRRIEPPSSSRPPPPGTYVQFEYTARCCLLSRWEWNFHPGLSSSGPGDHPKPLEIVLFDSNCSKNWLSLSQRRTATFPAVWELQVTMPFTVIVSLAARATEKRKMNQEVIFWTNDN